MGNEMGNNNVIGQQVSEETAKDFDKPMHHSDCSPGLNNINDKEKNDTKDVDILEVLKEPIISNGGDEKMASDQTKIPSAHEDIDEKKRVSLQYHASTQEDHVNSNLHKEEGDETQEDSETEITSNSTETVSPVGSSTEDMTSNKDTSSSDEQFKQLVHNRTEIKDVVIEDEPRERGNPSYVRPEDDINQEISKNEEKQEICKMSKSKSCKTTAIDTVIESDPEVLEEDRKINRKEEFPNCSAHDALASGEVVLHFQSASSTTDDKEFQKQKLSMAAAGEMSDSVSAATERNIVETTNKEQGVIVEKEVEYKNEADNLEGDNKSDGIHDFVSTIKVHGEDFTGLGPLLSGSIPILNGEELHEEFIIEELAAPMTAISFAFQLIEDSVKEDIKPASSDINEGTNTSTYEAKTIDTQETTSKSECDKPQQVLLEEPEASKFENSETLTTCMQLVECSSATELVFPNVFHKERGASDKAASFTSESNEKKVTWVVGFADESKQKKVIKNTDKLSEDQCLVQEPTLGRDAGEATPLLISEERVNSSSYSGEKNIKVVKDIPITNITPMQTKHEVVEESEKSPLLSPREPSEGAFRAPNHSVRKDKPLYILMTEDRVGRWSSLKEEEPVRKSSATISSPRSKEKQKPKASIFSICLCCTTSTN